MFILNNSYLFRKFNLRKIFSFQLSIFFNKTKMKEKSSMPGVLFVVEYFFQGDR